jgi:hypothetical protein
MKAKTSVLAISQSPACLKTLSCNSKQGGSIH